MCSSDLRGMLVQIPLPGALLPAGGAAALREALAAHYENCPAVRVAKAPPLVDGRFLDPEGANHAHGVELMVFGNDRDALLVARLDNLGKGAGGAAVQNLNLMLGCDPFTGLEPLSKVTP